jgi:hypothetical protein
MPAFKDINKLCSYLQTNYVDEVLPEDVTDAVRDVSQKEAEEHVYSVYPDPVVYQSRGLSGGLVADENIVGTLLVSGVLSVDYIAEFSQDPPSTNEGWGLAGLVEYGDGWNGHHYEYITEKTIDAAYHRPRPFVANTALELEDGQILNAVLRKGLRRKGLQVK